MIKILSPRKILLTQQGLNPQPHQSDHQSDAHPSQQRGKTSHIVDQCIGWIGCQVTVLSWHHHGMTNDTNFHHHGMTNDTNFHHHGMTNDTNFHHHGMTNDTNFHHHGMTNDTNFHHHGMTNDTNFHHHGMTNDTNFQDGGQQLHWVSKEELHLTLVLLNKLRCHTHFQFTANQITWSRLLL